MKKALVLLLGLGLWTLGCTATEDGKDAGPGNDILTNDGLGLDGYVPGQDTLGDQLEGDLGTDQGGWTGDLYEDIPQGLGEVFQSELCDAFCSVAGDCQMEEAGETCVADCLALLEQDANFSVKAGCLVETFNSNEGNCQALTICDDAVISDVCVELCGRVGECGMYVTPFNEMWGNSVDECLVACSSAAIKDENFEASVTCMGGALETCDQYATAECFGVVEGVCDRLCNGLDAAAATCGLIGMEAPFATADACFTWCTDLGLGNALAAESCINEYSGDMFFGFPLPASCSELATTNCLAGDLVMPEGGVAFAEYFFDLCRDNIEEDIPLPSVLAWRAIGSMQAAGLLEGADFPAAMACANTFETCPGKHAWMECFLDAHWDYSEADCQTIMNCQDQIDDQYLQGMTYGDCIFYCDYHKDTYADMLADMHTCMGNSLGVCSQVEICIAGPID